MGLKVVDILNGVDICLCPDFCSANLVSEKYGYSHYVLCFGSDFLPN